MVDFKNNINFTNEDLVNKVAYALHYHGWYKDTIEGKFGLETDGADHGRFRASKNAQLDEDFFSKILFNDEGYSLNTDEHNNPLYKKEDGKYYVDSAIKGWDFLPPSWKQENLEAAKVVIYKIDVFYTSTRENFLNPPSITTCLKGIGQYIHNEWVARQIAGEFGIDKDDAILLGTLTTDDLKYIKGETQEVKNPSRLLQKFGKEKLAGIWGIENFVAFKDLPFEEQLKDIRQVEYGLKTINAYTKNEIPYLVDDAILVEDKINQMIQQQHELENNKK